MKKEIWKPVLGYEGLYEVSNWGRARSLDRWIKGTNGSLRFCKGRILKLKTNNQGYLLVTLCKNGKKKTFTVHRLVAQAFLDNPNNLPCVNHKDENPQNNNAENLEWCSAKYNCNFGTRIERISKKCSKPVVQYTLDGQFVREWKSAKQAEREGGFKHSAVAACCRGKTKKHHKFIWKYK